MQEKANKIAKTACIFQIGGYNSPWTNEEKEAHSMMQNEKFTAFDLDDLIYGTITLVPSDR